MVSLSGDLEQGIVFFFKHLCKLQVKGFHPLSKNSDGDN